MPLLLKNQSLDGEVQPTAFPHGNIYMQVADRLGNIYHDAQFAALFPMRGQPAEAPARLALTTVLQFAEGLSDRQAADAVRSRKGLRPLRQSGVTIP